MVMSYETIHFGDVFASSMQVDACSRTGVLKISRKCLYSPEHYIEILRAVLKPWQTQFTAALVSNSYNPTQFSGACRPQLRLQLQLCGPEHPLRSDKWPGRGVAEPYFMVWCLRKRLKI